MRAMRLNLDVRKFSPRYSLVAFLLLRFKTIIKFAGDKSIEENVTLAFWKTVWTLELSNGIDSYDKFVIILILAGVLYACPPFVDFGRISRLIGRADGEIQESPPVMRWVVNRISSNIPSKAQNNCVGLS